MVRGLHDMQTARLEAFTDGVVAIIITIMVLELKVPESAEPRALLEAAPVMAAYVLSYVNVGLYWNNHHHLMHATEKVDGRVLWANLFLLFWLSLAPFVIRWMDEQNFAALPTAAYGLVFGMAGIGYALLVRTIIAANGRDSKVARATGKDVKGRLSVIGYIVATPLAFLAPWIAILIYVAIAAAWFIPDRRIARQLIG
jgi:uncharacterized membrane protein